MNLIGHYVCASHVPPMMRLGAVLPDLVSLYRRRVRPMALMREWDKTADKSPEQRAILDGMLQHQLVDLHFHRSPLFLDTSEGLIEAMLQASRTPGLRRFLPAHVLSEMYFDHLLLKEFSGLSARFHEELNSGGRALTGIVRVHPAADAQSFRLFLKHLHREQFAEGYRTLDGVFWRMNRILARFSQRPLESREEVSIAQYWEQHTPGITARLKAFAASMQAQTAMRFPETRLPVQPGAKAIRPDEAALQPV